MPELEQSRRLVTEIPGPASLDLINRKAAAVPRGVGNTMPVYAVRAGGGIVEDVDGNRLIDLGSGIAVTTVGNAAPRVVEAVQRQVADAQRLVQVDGGLHRAALAPRREVHECAHDDEQRKEDD